MSKKEQQVQALDPMRFQIAKNMAVLPGGPPNMQMNNPDNVISTFGANQGQAASRPGLQDGVGVNPYQDAMVQSPGLGTGVVMPIENSGLPQQMPVGTRLNQVPFGTGTMAVDQVTGAMMEGQRLTNTGFSQPMAQGSPMGFIGVGNPALSGGMPVDTDTRMPTEMGLQGFGNVEQVVGKKSKGGMSTGSGRRG